MNWGRRIRLYFVGFGIGLIICFILFRNRSLGNWLPGNRIKDFVVFSKKINADSTLLCRLKCEGISVDDIRKAASKGEVDYGKSDAQKEPNHEYDITIPVKGKSLEIYLSENGNDSTTTILRIYPESIGEKCGCK